MCATHEPGNVLLCEIIRFIQYQPVYNTVLMSVTRKEQFLPKIIFGVLLLFNISLCVPDDGSGTV